MLCWHDIGHFIATDPAADAIDDVHELRALGFLKTGFDHEVIEPIRLHVQAKRYLVSVDSRYAATLSGASAHTLALQGGPMSADERRWFKALPQSAEALMLRRDQADEIQRIVRQAGERVEAIEDALLAGRTGRLGAELPCWPTRRRGSPTKTASVCTRRSS